MNKTRAKAIKLYWNIAKERCPFHEEEMVNSFLEGFIDCAEYLLLQNTDLEKENAELKSISDFQTSSNMDRYFQLKRSKDQLTKAKEIIKTYYEDNFDEAEFYSLRKKAEQFLKDQGGPEAEA